MRLIFNELFLQQEESLYIYKPIHEFIFFFHSVLLSALSITPKSTFVPQEEGTAWAAKSQVSSHFPERTR